MIILDSFRSILKQNHCFLLRTKIKIRSMKEKVLGALVIKIQPDILSQVEVIKTERIHLGNPRIAIISFLTQ